MRRPYLLFIIALLVVATASGAYRFVSAANPVTVSRLDFDVVLDRDADLLIGVVRPGATLAGMLDGLAIDPADALALVSAIRGAFDVRRLRAGQPYEIDQLVDGRVRQFVYEIDDDSQLQVARAALDGPPRFLAAIDRIPKEVTVTTIEGDIDRQTNSLTAAIDKAGEGIDLALGLADVFSGEIDFNSDVQPGDRFRVLVERESREGVLSGYGVILAAEFVNAGRELRAVRFTPDGGKPGYYDERGRSLKRFFLKSPLKFEPRITSRFSSARRHPILNDTRAHHGVDYHAPTGAPVISVAPGVVTMGGWTSGGGRTVRVRHPNGYETEYLHLSAIAVRAGQRVDQGELLGKVGATGLATGPHLHYGLRKNGAYANPVIEHRNMPAGEPVPGTLLTTFNAERDRWLGLMLAPSRSRSAN
ncbi:MAG: M23 family metallopeptidase [Vicinamibacterales bacterium]